MLLQIIYAICSTDILSSDLRHISFWEPPFYSRSACQMVTEHCASPIFQSTHENKINIAKHSKSMLYLDHAISWTTPFRKSAVQTCIILAFSLVAHKNQTFSCSCSYFSYIYIHLLPNWVLFQGIFLFVFFCCCCFSLVANYTHTNRNYLRAVANPKIFLLPPSYSLSFVSIQMSTKWNYCYHSIRKLCNKMKFWSIFLFKIFR